MVLSAPRRPKPVVGISLANLGLSWVLWALPSAIPEKYLFFQTFWMDSATPHLNLWETGHFLQFCLNMRNVPATASGIFATCKLEVEKLGLVGFHLKQSQHAESSKMLAFAKRRR